MSSLRIRDHYGRYNQGSGSACTAHNLIRSGACGAALQLALRRRRAHGDALAFTLCTICSFIKAETLRFDTAADGPAAPAKRRHASDRHADNATAAAAPRKRHHAAHQSAASPAPGRPSAASSCHPPPQPPAAGAGAAAGGSIPSGNVGFQLLRKAGWRPGTGLGKHEHGSREPIAPPVQRSTRGVGYSAADPAPPAAAAPGAGKAAAPPGGAPALARQGRPAAAAAAAAVAAQGAAGGKRKGMGGGQAPQQDPAVASAVARWVGERGAHGDAQQPPGLPARLFGLTLAGASQALMRLPCTRCMAAAPGTFRPTI